MIHKDEKPMTNFIKLLFSFCKNRLMQARLVELMAAIAFVPPNLVTSMYGREKGGGR